MDEYNVDTRLLKILDLDLRISYKICSKVKFNDENLERLYQKNHAENNLFAEGNKIIILGWICKLLYIYFAYFRIELFCLCFFLFLVSLSLMAVAKIKNIISNNSINFIHVLLVTVNLNIKILYLNYLNVSNNEDNNAEILRTLIFDFVSNNLLTLLIIEENIIAKILFVLLNTFSAIISKFCSNNQKDCYEIDALTSICYSFIFFLLKKALENSTRRVFSERYCLEKLLYYTNDFILELNGLHFNRNIKETLASGKNIKEVFSDLINKNVGESEYLKEDKTVDLLTIPNNNDYNTFIKSLKIYDRNSKYSNSINNISLFEKLETVSNSIQKTNKFTNLGVFENLSGPKKYYEVFYRKFYITEFRIIDDIFFYDVTNYILAEEKIDEDSRIKQKVYAKISHEFKTPVNSIIGLIENIRDTVMTQDKNTVIKNLDNIKNLSKYVIYLTNDIIQYSSITNMRSISFHCEIINIREIVEFGFEILTCLLRCATGKNAAIIPILYFDSAIEDLIVFSDEVRIKQILLNFISNAVKFTKSASITIDAKCIEETQSIYISVIDTGVGITQEDQKKLFTDFTMIQNNQINNSFGTGLGLSVCKNISTNLNIKIHFSSEYGRGSTFSISIPYQEKNKNGGSVNYFIYIKNSIFNTELALMNDKNPLLIRPKKKIASKEVSLNLLSMDYKFASLNEEKQPHRSDNEYSIEETDEQYFPLDTDMDKETVVIDSFPKKIDYEAEISNKKNKILIVDDNLFINNSVKTLVEKIFKEFEKDYNVISASDGIEILQYIREDQSNGNLIKCVITDESMEYLNGSEAVKILKNFEKQGKIKHVNIITSTCYEDDNTKKYIFDCGSNIILSKPMNKIDVINAFKEFNII